MGGLLGGMFLDNVCVGVGVITLWLAQGRSYSLKQELPKINEGVGLRSNRLEGIIGLAVLLVIWVVVALAVLL